MKTFKQIILENVLDGGKADGKTIEDALTKWKENPKYKTITIDQLKEELKRGVAVEMEHTKDPAVSEKISLDHIYGEHPLYYTKFLLPAEKNMEEDLRNPKESKPDESRSTI